MFKKDDTEKCPMELIDPMFIQGVGWVLSIGKKKYGANNWKSATAEDIERVKGALLRHQMAYLAGEEFDPESELHHMYHVATNAMFLAHYDRNKARSKDDRNESNQDFITTP